MAMRRRDDTEQNKFLEVDASMQGSLVFKDPVNLRINGRFEGTLQTRGQLIIGEKAMVKAGIIGDSIMIAGEITGNLEARERLEIKRPGRMYGDVKTPVLIVEEGALLQGTCDMRSTEASGKHMTVGELARYMEVDERAILDWANSGRLPGTRKEDSWVFDRARIEEWVASEKIR